MHQPTNEQKGWKLKCSHVYVHLRSAIYAIYNSQFPDTVSTNSFSIFVFLFWFRRTTSKSVIKTQELNWWWQWSWWRQIAKIDSHHHRQHHRKILKCRIWAKLGGNIHSTNTQINLERHYNWKATRCKLTENPKLSFAVLIIYSSIVRYFSRASRSHDYYKFLLIQSL